MALAFVILVSTGLKALCYGPTMRAGLGLAIALLWITVARAAVIIVPDDYPSIQAAIDAAATCCDTIQVRPGTYTEALVVRGKGIDIVGLGGVPVISPGSTANGIVSQPDDTSDGSLTLIDVAIVGARVGVLAKAHVVALERVEITGCAKGAILKATTLSLRDTSVAGSRSFGLRASAPGPFVFRLTASSNAAEGAKIKNAPRNHNQGGGQIIEGVFDDNGKNGLVYVDRFDASIEGCEASRNGLSGIKVLAKQFGVSLENNQADDNGTYGFFLRGSVPDQTSLTNNGNTATGNGVQDFLIEQF